MIPVAAQPAGRSAGGCVLGIDTATTDAAVAAIRDGRAIAERRAGPAEDGRPRHGVALLPEIEEVVATAGGWEAIGRIGVGVGPGSYTGLRIGIATARALAQARGVEIAAVSTSAALIAGIGEHPGAAERPRLAVLDARRGEVFAELRPPQGGKVRQPSVLSPEELAEIVAASSIAPVAAGEGALRFRTQLEGAGAIVPAERDEVHRIAARYVCRLAGGSPPLPPSEVRPLYLREPDAEAWIERDRRDSD